jgi:outer membrane lipoprotein-sorting protein
MICRIIIITLFSILLGLSQSKDPDLILEKVRNKFNEIDSYKAEITVKVDVPFIKMPSRNATLYFKKPDKIHVESDGFAMLPKEGINFSPVRLFDSEHTSFYEKEEKIGDINASVVKIIPLNNESDLLLSTLWIDPVRNLIIKAESSRKPSGTFTIEFEYTEIEEKYHLPETIEFTFSVDPLMFHSRNPARMPADEEKRSGDSLEVKTGKVFLRYSNYEINLNLPDSIFNSE